MGYTWLCECMSYSTVFSFNFFFLLNPITILRAHMIAASALIWGPDVFLQQLINLSYNYNIISKFKLCDFVSNLIIPMFDNLNLPSWNIYVCISFSWTTSNKVLYLYLYLYLFELIDKEELYACVGLRLERFLKHLLLWICDLLQNTRFKWLSGSFCLSRLYRIVKVNYFGSYNSFPLDWDSLLLHSTGYAGCSDGFVEVPVVTKTISAMWLCWHYFRSM